MTWVAATDPDDHWCGKTHNQDQYDWTDAMALVNMGFATSEASSFKLGGAGWRLCGQSLDTCGQACRALGDCAEMSVNAKGCCLFGPTYCKGTVRQNDVKYLLVPCPPPPPSQPPSSPPLPS